VSAAMLIWATAIAIVLVASGISLGNPTP